MRSKLLSLTIIWLLSMGGIMRETAFAQTSEIRGTVKDRSGEPVAGARVVVKANGSAPRGAIVSIQGAFSVKNLASGEYEVSVTSVGYKEQKKKIVLDASQEINFVLVSAVSKMDEVVVTGQGSGTERKKLAVSVESMSVKQIENS